MSEKNMEKPNLKGGDSEKPKIDKDVLGSLFNGRNNLKDNVPERIEPDRPVNEETEEVVEGKKLEETDEEVGGKIKTSKSTPRIEESQSRGVKKLARASIRTSELGISKPKIALKKVIPEIQGREVKPERDDDLAEEIATRYSESEAQRTKQEEGVINPQESIVNLTELGSDVMQQEIVKLDIRSLTAAINNYVIKIDSQSEKLDSLQKEKEKQRIIDIRNVIRHKLAHAGEIAMTSSLDNRQKGQIFNELKMARENLENLYRKINIREKGSEIATEQRKVEETGPKEKIEEKEPLPVNKTQESATDLINIDPEQLKELENALDKPLSELSDRPLNKLQESELLISLEKLIMPLRQYVDYLRNNLEGLNSEQLKQELFRVSSLNNVLDQRLEELPVNDITQNLHNELKNLKVSYREIKNKIEISPIDSSSEKSEKRSSGKRKLSTEEKWQEDLSTYSIAGLKEEQENVNLKIDNLNKALESKTDNMNDRNLVEKEVGNLKKKLEIINKILLKEAPEPTTQQKPIDDIGIPEEVQEVPLTTYEQIKAKEEEIQRAEDRMAIYRPIGWFRKKPVVRDLGYYGLEADLNRLKGELKDLHTEAERKAKQAGKFEKELGKAQKTIFKNVAKEIIQEEKTGKKKTGFWKKLFSSKPERILTDEQILESVNKDRKFKKSMRKRYKTKYKE